jgi:hypothetical protein
MTFDLIKVKLELASITEQTLYWNTSKAKEQGVKFDPRNLSHWLFGDGHGASLLHYAEKLLLLRLVQSLKINSRILELGTYLGGSTAIMARARCDCQIITIDRFDDKTYVTEQQTILSNFLGQGNSRTHARVAARLAQWRNITVLEGISPYAFLEQTWEPFDLIIEDADHNNPGLKRNVDFWEPTLKAGGYYLFHDYRPWLPLSYDYRVRDVEPHRYLDVEQTVDELVNQKSYEFVGSVRGFAILKKPTAN